MITGIMLLVIATILVIVAIISYLDNKNEHIFSLLTIAIVFSLLGALTIDKQVDSDCVQIEKKDK